MFELFFFFECCIFLSKFFILVFFLFFLFVRCKLQFDFVAFVFVAIFVNKITNFSAFALKQLNFSTKLINRWFDWIVNKIEKSDCCNMCTDLCCYPYGSCYSCSSCSLHSHYSLYKTCKYRSYCDPCGLVCVPEVRFCYICYRRHWKCRHY